MKLEIKEIEQIANLARLELTDKEKNMYADQLSVVFNYIDRLNEVNTENVTETCQVTGLQNVTRDDVAKIQDDVTKRELVNCFPDKVQNLLKVKAVFNDE